MSASILERTARPRRSRTRSRTVNGRPALAVSTLRPHQYDLRPACASLVCPDCKTWVPITGIQAKRQKLVPHDTGRAGKDAAVRCQGSNRLVSVDVAFEVWQKRLEDGDAETAARRRTTVRRKPKFAAAPAVAHMVVQDLDAKGALRLYRAHAEQCEVCQESGHAHCAEGSPLARLYLYKLRNAPVAADRKAEEEPGDGRAPWLLRKKQWASIESAVRAADTRRAQLPDGDAPLGAPPVPLETLRPKRPAR
ncbi:hypothetical protein [Streptomyces sp. MC1]|uniref:hypothetical protein n=1 Tax=Streptomyces sp. MC1 TaxID=295105 RepID=UPI001E367095|nr:hypothetical protein [Streptomyces sp. MC1]